MFENLITRAAGSRSQQALLLRDRDPHPSLKRRVHPGPHCPRPSDTLPDYMGSEESKGTARQLAFPAATELPTSNSF